MTIAFEYNGKVRLVEVQKARADYVQGLNLHANAEIPAATYSIKKMKNVSVVQGSDSFVEKMLRI